MIPIQDPDRGDDHATFDGPLLIVGGTIKAGTSSVFGYLSGHPAICGSHIKETRFFAREWTGDAAADAAAYARYFPAARGAVIRMEATPSYLEFKENVAPRIAATAPDARLAFILREPAGRLYSHYRFALSKFEIPADITFAQFIDAGEQFLADPEWREGMLLDQYRRALWVGMYATHLRRFLETFDASQVRVVFYERLAEDPISFMTELCDFIGIDPTVYRSFEFQKSNVAFNPSNRALHRAVMQMNRMLEPWLRRNRRLKHALVGVYRRLNGKPAVGSRVLDDERERLRRIYAPSVADLAALLDDVPIAGAYRPPWLSPSPAVTAAAGRGQS